MAVYSGKHIKLQFSGVMLESIRWGAGGEWIFVCSTCADGAVESREGVVHVDPDVVARIDDAVHRAVALLTLAQRASFSASGVAPVVGLLGTNDELRPLVGHALNDLRPAITVPHVHDPIDLSIETISALNDRPDGLMLLAEALSDQNMLGRYVQLLRLLEHAFGSQLGKFNRELIDFLGDSATRHRFTPKEISQWVESRPRVMHSDRAAIWYARDVERTVHRLQEAATDVLFNKARWQQRDAQRRACRVPRRGTCDSNAGMFLTAGLDFKSDVRILEPFGSFPLFLGGGVESLVPLGLWAIAEGERLVLQFSAGPGETVPVAPPLVPSAVGATFVSGAPVVIYALDDDGSEEPHTRP